MFGFIERYMKKQEERRAIECVNEILVENNMYEIAKLYFDAYTSVIVAPTHYDICIIGELEKHHPSEFYENLMDKYEFPY